VAQSESNLERVVEQLRQLAAPTRIVLFGSHARGEAGPKSDYDILVIVPDDVDRRAVGLRVRTAIASREIDFPIEPIFRTESEFEARREQFAHLHWIIDREGRELYAA
jgi:predicted nucleotidyltransferase